MVLLSVGNIKFLLLVYLCFDCVNTRAKHLKASTSTAFDGSLEIETTTIDNNNENQFISNRIFSTVNQTVRHQQGSSAFLQCKIDNLPDDIKVNWLKDDRILTENRTTLDGDKRYLVPQMDSTDWSMEIRYTQKSDEGLYECRIENHGSASIFIKLELIEARAKIIGLNPKRVKANSPLRISCVLKRSIEAPRYIFWYKGDRVINYDLVDGSVREGRLGSELIFPKAMAQHSGNYSCVPSNAVQASVIVEVQ